MSEQDAAIITRHLGLSDYAQTSAAMRAFTESRDSQTPDEIWFLEHPPVFTQGQAGRAEHVLAPGNIPVIAANRGGQVTYHGPGQLVVYPLLDLHRRGIGIRELVTRLERAMTDTLEAHGIAAFAKADAPGVYVQRVFGNGPEEEIRKIGSIGLRVSRGCSYHGISLNVDMDLEPFSRINPCGYAGLRMTQMRELGVATDIARVAIELERCLRRALDR